MGTHASLSLWTCLPMQSVTATLICCTSCSWTSTIRSLTSLVILTKVVEIVEHEIHVFLFLALQMMNNALVFVNLNSDVRISLSRNGSRFDKAACLLIHVIAALCRGHIMAHVGIQPLLSTTHGLIVKFATLLL